MERQGRFKQVFKCKPSTCHPEKPAQARGLCKNCYDKWLKSVNPEYVARQHENNRKWVKTHQDRMRAHRAKYIAKQDPITRWASTLKRSFNLTPDDYNQMLERQGGRCAICRIQPTKKRLAVDHDHDTGRIRGLLCFRCNFGLSWFAEDAERLKRASDYLAEPGDSQTG